MFLKEVHLAPNHWSFRLLKWTFPWIARFNNFCPHFWLTILAIIILPFTLTLRIIYYVCIKWCAKAFSSFIEWVDNSLENRFLFLTEFQQDLGIAADNIYGNALYEDLLDCAPQCERNKIRKYRKLFNLLPYEKQQELEAKFKAKKAEKDRKIEELREYYRRKREIQEKKEEEKAVKHALARQAKKERKNVVIPRMMIAGKVLGVIILVPTALAATYYLFLALGWIGYWLIFYIPKVHWLTILSAFVIIVIVCGLVFLLIKFMRWVISKMASQSLESCENWRKFFRIVGWPFMMIFKLFAWMAIGIIDAAGFLWTGIKTFKSENCPAIIWEENKKDNIASTNDVK